MHNSRPVTFEKQSNIFYKAVNYKCKDNNWIDACMVGRDNLAIPSDVRLDLSDKLQAFIMLAIRGLKKVIAQFCKEKTLLLIMAVPILNGQIYKL